MTAQTTSRVLRLTLRVLLVGFALFWFCFAILSGADHDGKGIAAIASNLPNALPWLALLLAILITFRSEMVGGILVALMGFASIVFFNALTSPVILFAISLPLFVLSGGFIVCWFLDRQA